MKSNNIKERRSLALAITLVVGLSSVVLANLTGWVVLFLPALAAAVWFVVWTLRNWKCPHCGAFLNVSGVAAEKIEFCPRCGGRLDEPPVK